MKTPRENLLRTLRRQGCDWVPVDSGGFCPSQAEAFRKRFGHDDIAGYFRNPHRFVGIRLEPRYANPRELYPREELPEEISFDAMGVGHSVHPGCFHMTRMHHPLKGEIVLEEIERYPFPVLDPGSLAALPGAVAGLHADGLVAIGAMACTVWERSWYMRSMEDLMADMMFDDPRAVRLLDRVTEMACETSRRYARAGVDILQFGDDIGMQKTPMIGLDLWRRWLKPRLASVIRCAREENPGVLVFYHSCGYVLPFLEELIEIGVDILNPVQPESMDLAEVLEVAAGRLSYWGTVGTQTTLPFGTPEQVREVVLRNVALCGDAGGIVIGPTHMVEPEVPWENLEAMRLAAAEAGGWGGLS